MIGLLWLLLCVGLWGAQGLVAGVPLAALTWLAVGFLVSGAAGGGGARVSGEDKRSPSRTSPTYAVRAPRALAAGRGRADGA